MGEVIERIYFEFIKGRITTLFHSELYGGMPLDGAEVYWGFDDEAVILKIERGTVEYAVEDEVSIKVLKGTLNTQFGSEEISNERIILDVNLAPVFVTF